MIPLFHRTLFRELCKMLVQSRYSLLVVLIVLLIELLFGFPLPAVLLGVTFFRRGCWVSIC